MQYPNLNIIVAADENNAIGNKGQMPWRLSADMKFFKATTMGHTVIMGRKTYDSVGRPLPGRRNIVVSRQAGLEIAGCEVYESLEVALEAAAKPLPAAESAAEGSVFDTETFIMGGAQIYAQAWDMAHRLYLTRVHTQVAECDVHIPAVEASQWTLQEPIGQHTADEKNQFDVTFEVYEHRHQ